MKKVFCDSCDQEITEANILPLPYRFEMTKGDQSTTIQVDQVLNASFVHLDWCKYCVIDKVNTLDDRPQPA